MPNPASIRNVLIHARFLMPVVAIRIVSLRIILEFAHANREQLVTHYWVVCQCNTAVETINVHQERFVRRVFAQICAVRTVTVLAISSVFKACVNQHAMAIPAVLTSNTA